MKTTFLLAILIITLFSCQKKKPTEQEPSNPIAPADTVYCCYTQTPDTSGGFTIGFLSCEQNQPGGYSHNIAQLNAKYSGTNNLVIAVKNSCSICPH